MICKGEVCRFFQAVRENQSICEKNSLVLFRFFELPLKEVTDNIFFLLYINFKEK